MSSDYFQIFRRFEYPAEISRLTYLNTTLVRGRRDLLETIIDAPNFTNIEVKLEEYEEILHDAFSAGLPVVGQPAVEKWTILKAVFFSSTVLTTIGEYTFWRKKNQNFCLLASPSLASLMVLGHVRDS